MPFALFLVSIMSGLIGYGVGHNKGAADLASKLKVPAPKISPVPPQDVLERDR